MRRVLISIVVTLLLATLLQYAIAWGLWTRLQRSKAFLTPTQAELDAWNAFSADDPSARAPFVFRRRGGLITSSQGWVLHRMGWPFLSFESRLDSAFRTTVAYRRVFDHGGWLVGWRSGLVLFSKDPTSGRTQIIDLALRPIPAGFAANTVIFGIPIWVLVFGIRGFKRSRRRRLGQCVRCGYLLDGMNACPECGTASRPTPDGTRVRSFD
ncbi:MAG: hypothetical protein KDA28_01955 [Phycisphaerales bacterium]|nr:hypothetical protein [Phycisphaerales bacterium]